MQDLVESTWRWRDAGTPMRRRRRIVSGEIMEFLDFNPISPKPRKTLKGVAVRGQIITIRRRATMPRTADIIWLDDSIVAKRGIGWGGKSRLHDLTEAAQGKYHYTIGPYSDPVLTVRPGDRIRVETRDAFEGAIRSESDK